MRIIHLVRCTSWGGGERYALDLCRRAAQEGMKVTVVTRGNPAMDANFSGFGAELVKMPLGGPLDFVSPVRLASLILNSPEERVAVHVHNFKDAEIAAKARLILRGRKKFSLVCTRHLVKRGKRSPRWRFIFNAIDALIFVSKLARDEFLKGNPPVEPGRISVVSNSVVVPDGFSLPAPPPAPSSSLRLLFTGRISPEKGVDILIRALPLVAAPVSLTVCGTGDAPYTESLRALAESLGVADRICWKGFVECVYPEIRGADVCVAPSVWREPFGLTIIEFMSQGRPVVTTSNGAQCEIITDGADGLLVPPSSPEALAEAIASLAASPSLRESIGSRAAASFRSRFSYDVFFKRISEIYHKAPLS